MAKSEDEKQQGLPVDPGPPQEKPAEKPKEEPKPADPGTAVDTAKKAAPAKARTPEEIAMDKVKATLGKLEQSMAALLPKHLTTSQMIKAALVSCTKTPQLLQCTPKSWMLAMMRAAETGLMPGGAMNHAHLLPFRNNRAKTMEVVFVPGYQGLISLARNTGVVENIAAHVVYAKDVFDVDFGTETVSHKPFFDGDPGAKRLVYARAKIQGGEAQFEVLRPSDIAKIKAMARGSGDPDSPWVKWEDEMWRKSAIKRISKYLPLSTEHREHRRFASAIAIDNEVETGEIEMLPEFLEGLGDDGAPAVETTATEKLTKELTGAQA